MNNPEPHLELRQLLMMEHPSLKPEIPMNSLEDTIKKACAEHGLAAVLHCVWSLVVNNTAGLSQTTPTNTRDEIAAKLALAETLAGQKCCKDSPK